MTYKSFFKKIMKPEVYIAGIESTGWTSGSYFSFYSGSGNMTNITTSSDTLTLSPGRYMCSAFPSNDSGVGTSTVAEFTWEANGQDEGIVGRFNDYSDFSDRDTGLIIINSDSQTNLKLKIISDASSTNITSSDGHIVIWSENEL